MYLHVNRRPMRAVSVGMVGDANRRQDCTFFPVVLERALALGWTHDVAVVECAAVEVRDELLTFPRVAFMTAVWAIHIH